MEEASPEFMIVIDEIKIVDERRTDLGDIESLQGSIERIGQLNAILINKKDNSLVSGYRRLTCHKNLGLKKIRAKYYQDLTALERKVITLEENLHEKLHWFEAAKLREEIQALQLKIKGSAVRGHESEGQSLQETADMLGISVGTLSQDISLVKTAEVAPQIKKFASKRQALKSINKLKEMAILTELAKREAEDEVRLSDVRQPYSIFKDDAVSFTKEKIDNETVDLVIFDPPWGIDADLIASERGPRGEKVFYDDSEGASRDLCRELLPELYRIMKDATHMYFFVGFQHVRYWTNILTNRVETVQPDWTVKSEVMEKGREWTFEVREIPLIWVKEGGGFTDFDYKFMPRYEALLFCTKGSRPLNYPISDVFDKARPLTVERIHSHQKPVALLKEFVKISTHANEIVYDPCMGSGASIVAATMSGRRAIGVEKNAEAFLKAQDWIKGFSAEEEEKK